VRVAPGEKFACYAFTRCGLAEGMPREINLRPRLWAATSLDLDVAEHWQTWLGSITMGELREANLIIYTTMASSRPEILDDENAALVKTLDYVLFGLVLQGIPVYYRGYSLNGAHVAGEVEVRQFSHLSDRPDFHDCETRETLNQIFGLRSRIEHVHDPLAVLDGNCHARIATANRRTRQADVLARFALTRVLENDQLFEMFRTDAGIEQFWALPDATRAAAWGSQLDLTTVE
jgi:hypothetical protein